MEHIEALGPEACLRLLAGQSLGRVAYTERALPAIRPVNYALVGQHLILRTRPDGLAARLDGQVIAFEVDDATSLGEFTWSVTVTGTARVLRDPDELIRLDAVQYLDWMGPEHATAVEITAPDVQGRRVLPIATGAAEGPRRHRQPS